MTYSNDGGKLNFVNIVPSFKENQQVASLYKSEAKIINNI